MSRPCWTAAAVSLWVVALVGRAPAAGPTVLVTAHNLLDRARPSETIVLSAADLRRQLAIDDVRLVHVRDDRANRELLTQAVDTNDDGAFEEFLFQVDLAALETRTFSLTVGERLVPQRDEFKAYGRFVRERRDDFAWENDRVAHRMYGAALETWAQEPLTSSAVDVWVKRVRRLVINDWYMVDDYHRDTGEGADLYSAGRSRGCGGNGVWAGGRLYPPPNFRDSRVLANGPIRVMFELTYLPWDANGRTVSEVKRVTLDAGQNVNRFESRYTPVRPAELVHAAGIKKSTGSIVAADRARGVLRTWEPLGTNGGQLGCGLIVDPDLIVDLPQDELNYLVAAKVPSGSAAVYHVGSAWDRSGDFPDVAAWDRYLDDFARRLRSPLEITVVARQSDRE